MVVVEGCCDGVEIVAEDVFDGVLERGGLVARLRGGRARRAVDDVHQRVAELVSRVPEDGPVVRGELLLSWSAIPRSALGAGEGRVVDGVVEDVPAIPRLTAGGAMNVHGVSAGAEQRFEFVFLQVLRLVPELADVHVAHGAVTRQPGCRVGGTVASCIIGIEHEGDLTTPAR